jgi:WD40 repeat protein
MSRVLLASWVLIVSSAALRAAEPKPLWELASTPSPEPAAAPGWLSYSPAGDAIVAVTIRASAGERPEYTFHLRVWDAATRKERFNAALGSGKSFHWGDELASFLSDDSVMTGGQMIVVRNLQNGNQTTSMPTSGLADHAVWAVPDLKESFHLRRDPERFNLPLEFTYRGQFANHFDEWGGRMTRGQNGMLSATLAPPREGLRTEVLAMNAGRTRLAVAFRDESSSIPRRHAVALYRVKTVEEFEFEPIAETTNPHPGPVTALTFARNGRLLATGAEDGSVLLWDLSDRLLAKPRTVLSGAAAHRVYALAFSNDWRYLAAATWDRSKPNLYLIEIDTGRLAASLKLERQLTAVAWHPEGHTLLTTGVSGTIKAWDLATLLRGN